MTPIVIWTVGVAGVSLSIGVMLGMWLQAPCSPWDDDPGGWADAESIRRHEELRRELGRCRR